MHYGLWSQMILSAQVCKMYHPTYCIDLGKLKIKVFYRGTKILFFYITAYVAYYKKNVNLQTILPIKVHYWSPFFIQYNINLCVHRLFLQNAHNVICYGLRILMLLNYWNLYIINECSIAFIINGIILHIVSCFFMHWITRWF